MLLLGPDNNYPFPLWRFGAESFALAFDFIVGNDFLGDQIAIGFWVDVYRADVDWRVVGGEHGVKGRQQLSSIGIKDTIPGMLDFEVVDLAQSVDLSSEAFFLDLVVSELSD